MNRLDHFSHISPPKIGISRPHVVSTVHGYRNNARCLGETGRMSCAAKTIAFCFMLFSISFSPIHLAQADESEIVLPDLVSVRAVFANPNGQLRAVGERREGSGVGLLDLNSNLQVLRQTAVPLPESPDLMLRRITPEGAYAFSDGDIVIVGHAEAAKDTSTGRHGWAARVRPDGTVVWNRIWPQAGSKQTAEYFYFVRLLRSDTLIVGGKSQEGPDTCRDPASGVTLEINALTGASVGQRRLYKNAGRRQGFRDLAIGADGTLILAGWVAQDPAQGRTWCPDDIWVLEVTRDQPGGISLRQGAPGTDVLLGFAGQSPDGSVFVGYTQPDPARPPSAILAVIQAGRTSLQLIPAGPAGQPFSWLQGAVAIGSGNIIMSVGQAGPTDAKGNTFAWLRFYETDLHCGHDLLLPAHDRTLQVKALAATQLQNADIVVAGQVMRNGTVMGGWIGKAQLQRDADRGSALHFDSLSDNKPSSLIGITSDKGKAFTARATFELKTATPVSIWSKALGADDLTIVLRKTDGMIIAVSDQNGSAAEFIDRELPAGRYNVEILSVKPRALFAMLLRDKPTNASQWLNARTVEIDAQPYLRKSLLIKALQHLGYRISVDVEISTGMTTASSWEAYERDYCQASGQAGLSDRLRTLFKGAAEKSTHAAELARVEWQRQRAVGAMKRMNIVKGGEIGGELLFTDLIDGRRYGEVLLGSQSLYEGEVKIAPSAFWIGEYELDDDLLTGFGVRHFSDGSTVSAYFNRGMVSDFGQLRNAAGVVYHGVIRTVKQSIMLGQQYQLEFGTADTLDGGHQGYGDVNAIGVGCRTDETARAAGILLGCIAQPSSDVRRGTSDADQSSGG